MKQRIMVNTTKAGWQAFNLKLNDTIVLDKNRLFIVDEIISENQVMITPAPLWEKIKFTLSELVFKIKLEWMFFRRRFK